MGFRPKARGRGGSAQTQKLELCLMCHDPRESVEGVRDSDKERSGTEVVRRANPVNTRASSGLGLGLRAGQGRAWGLELGL